MQTVLPMIPAGASAITPLLSAFNQDGNWIYHVGTEPIFSHREDDRRSFKLITSQLIDQGACKQTDVSRVFGVPAISVKRAVKAFRASGAQAFFGERGKRGGSVLVPATLAQAQDLLDQGFSRREVCGRIEVKLDTLKKAIHSGRLREPSRSTAGEAAAPASAGSTKSERAAEDADCLMGTACSRMDERVAAAFGEISRASICFEAAADLKYGGALCALPALEANGLFRFLDRHFRLPPGYYDVPQVVLCLAFMALVRIKSAERLRFEAPGELGRLLGLDRVPEVKTLRAKIRDLCTKDNAQQWMLQLAEYWMEETPDLAGVFYVDGHVRLYHGSQTELPRRYVSRQRLCLRGVTDYWVNDAIGQPFFVVSKTVNEGMTAAIVDDLVPKLLAAAPQPTAEELAVDPLLPTFVLVFDRESSGRALFKKLWDEDRVACISYQKNVKDVWAEAEFSETTVTMPDGGATTLRLAERGTLLGAKAASLWVKEVRKLTASGHQVSMISTAYLTDCDKIGAFLLNRWTQENFFGYAMEHYGIDRLVDYGIEDFPDTNQRVVNPAWRDANNAVRSLSGKLSKVRADFAACVIEHEKGSGKISECIARKAELQEDIEVREAELETRKQQRRELNKHVPFGELPPEYRFKQLSPSRKAFSDTIKMIAYRSETAMARILAEQLGKPDDARRLACEIMQCEADLIPDPQRQVLRVNLHRMANPQADKAVRHLLSHLNDTDSVYPGTAWRLRYQLVGDPAPPDPSDN